MATHSISERARALRSSVAEWQAISVSVVALTDSFPMRALTFLFQKSVRRSTIIPVTYGDLSSHSSARMPREFGYNFAEQWVNLLRSRRNVIAKEMGITPSNLRWVAAYHNKETNPHVHMMVWSSRPGEPYLSREGIHNIKQTLASDIFRQEHLQFYKKQTEARDDIKTSCRNRIEALVTEIRSGNHAFSPEIIMKMQLLSEKLQRHKGKKIYGYLDKNTKALVKDIVKLLGADEQVARIYNAWYSYKCEIVRTYTDEVPDKIPIEEQRGIQIDSQCCCAKVRRRFSLHPHNRSERSATIMQS